MKNRFIVSIDNSSEEQNKAFLSYIKEQKIAWWHWLPNTWLLTDKNGKLTCSDIRNKLMEIYPGINCLVIELNSNGDTWAGFGPDTEEKSMFSWIERNWKSK